MPREEEATRIYRRGKKKAQRTAKYEKWRSYWREAGPVRFAEEFLKCPPDVPDHPDLGRVPEHLILSEDQKRFLLDLWKNGVTLVILSAGRGAGKTFILAIRDCWLLCCFDDYKITFMAGSQEQSNLCQEYIDFWRDWHPEVNYCLPKSVKGVKPKILSRFRGLLRFGACSATSARGPHVRELQLDEVTTAEDKSEEGAKAVDAAWWQTVGKKDTVMIMTSTTHYVHGRFAEILDKPEEWGFTRYIWSIVRHKSGEPAEKMFKDRNPDNWVPNYWWITRDDIKKLRKKGDEEWLCEALGYPSIASGAVFSGKDLDLVFCGLCEECEPYKWGKCHLAELLKLGDQENPIKFVEDRRAGYDYGDKAPSALVIGGRKGDFTVILWADELKGARTRELLEWIDSHCKEFGVNVILPDPSAPGAVVSDALEEMGYAVYVLGISDKEKMRRLWNVRTWVERHRVVIPKAFWNLTRSLRKLSWDKEGKIRKFDDHSADALCYLMTDWRIGEGEAFELWEKIIGKRQSKPRRGKQRGGVKFGWD